MIRAAGLALGLLASADAIDGAQIGATVARRRGVRSEIRSGSGEPPPGPALMGADAMEEPYPPEAYARMARVSLWMVPFGAVLVFLLAAVQGAELWICVMLAGVMAVGCLGAAALLHLRGAKAGQDAAWIALIFRLLARR